MRVKERERERQRERDREKERAREGEKERERKRKQLPAAKLSSPLFETYLGSEIILSINLTPHK